MRVNAKHLADYQNEMVCLVGRFLQCKPNGMSFKMESPDKKVVQINLKEPIQEPLEGIIEVIGKVTAKLTIFCESYVVFPPELAENFDMDAYNDFVATLKNFKDNYPATP
ncbi:replication protein A 14 kDa subunit-like [Dermacentor andersoni]|uniref:replication protein A 14 kDa subunit-like n=1 Tax=Dermacentor andersoni TaxID=34620 RepID=UPI0021550B1A|nr:replication protein A 14 kDa subunit-like [Dermacentor andersoni]